MKPTSKQLGAVKHDLALKREASGLSNAEISRISGVHQSQVGRICGGQFKTFSFSVAQICNVLNVPLPRTDASIAGEDPSWVQVQSSMRNLWDKTPEGAKAITKMIDAVAKLAPRNRNKPKAE